MKLKLINNNSKKLILFLTGWGCDANQFSYMKSKKYNILICYDYSDTKLNFDFSTYEEINLLAFSAGVLMSCVLKDKLPEFNKKIAFNGNPKNFDKYYGVPEKINNDFKSITHSTVIPFRKKYMVYDSKELQICNKYHPCRGLEDSYEEFDKLEEYYRKAFDIMHFDLVMLSDSDKIFNLQKQEEYFKNQNYKVIHNCAHYPFYKYNDFDEIMNLV